jgi:hypothetical protein
LPPESSAALVQSLNHADACDNSRRIWLPVNVPLAELDHRSHQAVDIGGFAPKRNFACAYSCQVQQIIDQPGFELQVKV